MLSKSRAGKLPEMPRSDTPSARPGSSLRCSPVAAAEFKHRCRCFPILCSKALAPLNTLQLFVSFPQIIEYTINQILSTKIFRGNRKARLKPRPSSGMLPSEPCPPNGGHGAAAHLLPRTYRCRSVSQKNQSDLMQTARNPRAVFPYYCLFGCSICIYFQEVYADNSDGGLFFCI